MRRIRLRPVNAHAALQGAAPRKVKRPAFTLVELLVVIGIIAVLIAVLLPVLAGVAARGRDLHCQSNIRQTLQLIHAYAAENKGQLPYGWYWARGGGDPEGWGPEPGSGNHNSVELWTVLNWMAARRTDVEDPNVSAQPSVALKDARFLRCPEALLVRRHVCTYVGNLVAFVSPCRDAQGGATRHGPAWTRLIEKPTKLAQCLPFTALVWESAVVPEAETRVVHPCGGSIDGERFLTGSTRPQVRYYSPNDPFARLLPGVFGNERPVLMDSTSGTWRNIDPPQHTFPYDGNLRFRHGKGTTCNAGFADGHVGKFTASFKTDGRIHSNDAMRKHFMVKWPSGAGIGPNPSLPH